MSTVDLGSFRVHHTSVFRDTDNGRFAAACDEGAHAAAEEMADLGAALAIANAAGRFQQRTGALVGGIDFYMETATKGVVVSQAPYSAPLEKGAAPHSIGEEGQKLGGNSFSKWRGIGPVAHPGNKAAHFLGESMKVMTGMAREICARNMP